MKRMATTFACLVAFAICAHSQDTKQSPVRPGTLKKVPVLEATNYYNQTMVVTGRIVQVNVRPSIVYLNFEKPYPDSPLSAVVFSKSTNHFGRLTNLQGKQVEISGLIKEYHGKPEIVLDNSNQVVVVEARGLDPK